jgi:hypothetical protein
MHSHTASLRRRVRARTTLATLLIVLFGCGNLVPPAYRLDLTDSAWTVVAVGDAEPPAGAEPSIVFERSSAVIRTGCQSMSTGLAIDTDGHAIGFERFEVPYVASCPTDIRQFEATLTSALASVDRWEIDHRDGIRLIGQEEIILHRFEAWLD